MIIKLQMKSTQLDALHECLKHPDNHYVSASGHSEKADETRSYVWIKSVKGRNYDAEKNGPVPGYNVIIEVEEIYYNQKSKHVITPLNRLARVLQAVGLFPVEDNIPA
jgi:hypothetical protein